MKVPEPKQLKCGDYYIQLRLGGKSLSVRDRSKTMCIKKAEAIKSAHRIGQYEIQRQQNAPETLRIAIDLFLKDRTNTLSPSTIRGYRIIQKNRFQSIMDKPLSRIQAKDWQKAINEEAHFYSSKTVKNSWGFICTVIKKTTGSALPEMSLPGIVKKDTPFLHPNEILSFVQAAFRSKLAVPLLLALSSMRISEIAGVSWEDIPLNADFIPVNGTVVQDENNKWVKKKQTKNLSSHRNVPVLIPELKQALARDRKTSGPVLTVTQGTLRKHLKRICIDNNLTVVSSHGLRHSFASLAYHLQIPERIAMEIGGWADDKTMHNIYIHIAQNDIKRYETAMSQFYKNANEFANKTQ